MSESVDLSMNENQEDDHTFSSLVQSRAKEAEPSDREEVSEEDSEEEDKVLESIDKKVQEIEEAEHV